MSFIAYNPSKCSHFSDKTNAIFQIPKTKCLHLCVYNLIFTISIIFSVWRWRDPTHSIPSWAVVNGYLKWKTKNPAVSDNILSLNILFLNLRQNISLLLKSLTPTEQRTVRPNLILISISSKWMVGWVEHYQPFSTHIRPS